MRHTWSETGENISFGLKKGYLCNEVLNANDWKWPHLTPAILLISNKCWTIFAVGYIVTLNPVITITAPLSSNPRDFGHGTEVYFKPLATSVMTGCPSVREVKSGSAWCVSRALVWGGCHGLRGYTLVLYAHRRIAAIYCKARKIWVMLDTIVN